MPALITRRKVLIAAPAILLLPRRSLAQTSTTWNPSDKNANITLSGGDLVATQTATNTWVMGRAQNAQTVGASYIEMTLNNFPSPGGGAPTGFGLANSSASQANGSFLGIGTTGFGFYPQSGGYTFNSATVAASPQASGTSNAPLGTSGDVIALMADINNYACYVKNVTTFNLGTVTTLSFKAMSLITFGTGGIMAAVAFFVNTAQATANFGASAFTGTVPTLEFGSGWNVTTPTPPTCRWSAVRSSPYCRITGTLDNIVDHTTQDNWHRAVATIFHATGKYYCEMDVTLIGSTPNWIIGISTAWGYLNGHGASSDNSGISWLVNTGQVIKNNAVLTTIQTAAQGDTCGMATDFDNKKVWFRTNGGNWNNDVLANQNPATNTGGIDMTSVMVAQATFGPTWAGLPQNSTGTGAKGTARFGQTGFSFGAPSGFSGWAPTAATGGSRGYIIQ